MRAAVAELSAMHNDDEVFHDAVERGDVTDKTPQFLARVVEQLLAAPIENRPV